MKPFALWMVSLIAVCSIETAAALRVEEVWKQKDIVWSFEFLSENEILANEKSGQVIWIDLKARKALSVGSPPQVTVHGQGGLLDIAKDPHFPKEPWLYFAFTVQNAKDSWTTRIARAHYEKQSLSRWQILFTADLESNENIHFGSRLAFDRSGQLYFSVGDRGQRDFAQDLSRPNGKIFRILRDGGIPKDNPFQGPRGGDEINVIRKGANYGWPIVTYGREYYGPKIGEGVSKVGMEDPLYQFTPSIALCGLMIYSGKIFKVWKGDLFSGALAGQHLNRLKRDSSPKSTQQVFKEERLFKELGERIRSIRESPEGLIYFSTDSGKIYRVSGS